MHYMFLFTQDIINNNNDIYYNAMWKQHKANMKLN